MLRKLVILGMCAVILASLVGCQEGSLATGNQPWAIGSPGPTAIPTPEATAVLETVVNADGALASMRPTLSLGFQVSGRVTEVLVRPGDTVKSGQVLARLDKLALENTLREAEARLEQSRFELDKTKRAADSGTDLKAAEMGLEAARLGVVSANGNYTSTLLRSDVTGDVRMAKFWADYWANDLGDKWLRLNEKPNSDQRRIEYEQAGARSENATNQYWQIQQDAYNNIIAAQHSVASAQQQYQSALSSYNSIKNGDPVRSAELQVLIDETALTRAQMDLANAELKAPWDGMVDRVDITVGSQAADTPAITLVDIQQLQFVTNNLSERDLGRVTIGQKATLTLKTFTDAKLTGKVAAIAPLSGQPVGDATTFAVRIALDSTDLALRPGMTGQAQIVVK
jgi:multidrug resistance efflux pump